MLTAKQVAETAVKALDDKKARDIVLLKTNKITSLADYFIICTAGSTSQIKTLSEEVGKRLAEQGETARRTEGYRDGGWVLVDFGCVVIHIFLDEMRKFYNLERLWSDAPRIDISEIVAENE